MEKHTALLNFIASLGFLISGNELEDRELSRIWIENGEFKEIKAVFEEYESIQLLHDKEKDLMYFFMDWDLNGE